jgi:hypothetical protein
MSHYQPLLQQGTIATFQTKIPELFRMASQGESQIMEIFMSNNEECSNSGAFF